MEDKYDIVLENVGKTYNSDGNYTVALAGVDLKIERSQIICIVGPSGCGKSTLVKIMLGLLKHDQGSMFFNPSRIKKTAYVQQQPTLFPWRTVLQNACLGAELRGNFNKADVNRIKHQIKEFGLGGCENKFPDELSGGMKQRVNIINALESRPDIMFCDEPFSAIDFVTRLDLNTKFKTLCGIGKMTTIFITHNIEEAIFLGDVVVVMSGQPGKIVAVHEPKFSKHKYDAMQCRELPEFHELVKIIWEDLKSNYVA